VALIKTADNEGKDCVAVAPPNVEEILNNFIERHADDIAEAQQRVV